MRCQTLFYRRAISCLFCLVFSLFPFFPAAQLLATVLDWHGLDQPLPRQLKVYSLEFMSLIDAHFGESTHLTTHPDHWLHITRVISFQLWSFGGATCIVCKFGYQVLALDCPISIITQQFQSQWHQEGPLMGPQVYLGLRKRRHFALILSVF